MKDCKPCINRRRFLELSSQSISASFSAVALAGPVAGLLASCSQQPLSSGSGTSQTAAVTPTTNTDGGTTLSFSDYPTLNAVGGSLLASIQTSSGKKTVYITRVSSTTATVVSNICSHEGCDVDAYNSSLQQFQCPCHNSNFDSNGKWISGPAVKGLTSYSATVTSTGIQITS